MTPMNRPTFRSESSSDARLAPARPAALAHRAARGACALLAAAALSGCAGMTFQFANTLGYPGSGQGSGGARPPVDLYDPASPVNIWNIL